MNSPDGGSSVYKPHKTVTISPMQSGDSPPEGKPPMDSKTKAAAAMHMSMDKSKEQASALYRNMLYKIYKGFNPKYVWKDGKIGGIREYVGHGEEELTWMLFFKDICYVAYLAQCAHTLADCTLSVDVIIIVMFAVSNMYNLRVIILDYSCKFFADDYVHRIAYFLFITGIVLMAKNTSTMLGLGVDIQYNTRRQLSVAEKHTCAVNYEYLQKYVVGLTIAKASMFFLHALQGYNDTSRKFLQQYWLKNVVGLVAFVVLLLGMFRYGGTGTSLALLMISSEMETVANIIVFYLLKYTRMAFTNLQPYHYPVNYLLTQEAAGIYIMIFIGECIFKLTQNTAMNLNDTSTLSDLLTLLLLFVFCTQYYDRVQRASHQSHVVQRNFFYGYIWFYCHKWLALCILFMTVGFGDFTSDGKYILSIGCGFATALMVFMRMLHKGVMYRLQKRRRLAYQLIEIFVAIAHFLVVLLPDSVPHYAMVGIHACIALFLSFFNSSLFVQLSDGWDEEAIEDDVDWGVGSQRPHENITRDKSASVYSMNRDAEPRPHSRSLRLRSLVALERWDQEVRDMELRRDSYSDSSAEKTESRKPNDNSLTVSSPVLDPLSVSDRNSEGGDSPSRSSTAIDELRYSHLYSKGTNRAESTEDFNYFSGDPTCVVSGSKDDWYTKSTRLPKALFLHGLVDFDDTKEDFNSYVSGDNSSFRIRSIGENDNSGRDDSITRPKSSSVSSMDSIMSSIVRRVTLSFNGRPTPQASQGLSSLFLQQTSESARGAEGMNITL